MEKEGEHQEAAARHREAILNALREAQRSFEGDGDVKIIFDTDLGSYIDDALALLMLTHHNPHHQQHAQPQQAQHHSWDSHPRKVELLGVTTVYGNTHLRAAVARKSLPPELSDTCPVIAGIGTPIRSPSKVWHCGKEGKEVLSTKEMEEAAKLDEDRNAKELQGQFDNSAPDFILEQLNKYPGQVTLVCLGPLTNIAHAIQRGANDFSKKVKRIIVMGGGVYNPRSTAYADEPIGSPVLGRSYTHTYSSWNIKCDIGAAELVFHDLKDVDLYMITIDCTRLADWPGQKAAKILTKSKEADRRVVGKMLKIFLKEIVPGTTTTPFDAVAVAEAIYPGRFVHYARGVVLVAPDNGSTTFVLDPIKGRHWVGLESRLHAKQFLEYFNACVLPAGTQLA